MVMSTNPHLEDKTKVFVLYLFFCPTGLAAFQLTAKRLLHMHS